MGNKKKKALLSKWIERSSRVRSCHDCKYLKSYVSWWCTNKKACDDRGTKIPGVIKCPYWEVGMDHLKRDFEKRIKLFN